MKRKLLALLLLGCAVSITPLFEDILTSNSSAAVANTTYSVKVIISDKFDKPLTDAFVTITNNRGRYVDGRSMRKGFAYFNLPKGTYTATAVLKEYKETKISFIVDISATKVGMVMPKNPITVFMGNPPRRAAGEIDVKTLNKRLTTFQADGYIFIPGSRSSENPDDYSKHFETILKSVGRHVSLDIQSFNHPSVRPYDQDYITWAAQTAKLSLKYKDLTSFIIDDYYGSTGKNTFDDITYARQVCDAAKKINPDLKIYATLYCTPKSGDETYWIDRFMSQLADPVINNCFTGVYLFTSPKYTRSVDKPVDMINTCISDLQIAKKEVIEGIYISDLYNFPISPDEALKNVTTAKATHPDGFAVYLLPEETDTRAVSSVLKTFSDTIKK